MPPRVINETINVSAVSIVVKGEVVDHGILSKPSAMHSTIKLIDALYGLMEAIITDQASSSEPKAKKAKVGRPSKKPTINPPAKKSFAIVVDDMKEIIDRLPASDGGPTKIINGFFIERECLMYTHAITLRKTNSYNVGRLYPTSLDDVPPLIQLPKIVRTLCMSERRSLMTWAPPAIEFDQKTCHLAIIHWLMLQAGKPADEISWMRDAIANSDAIRREVAEHYLEDSNAILARDLMERMTTATGMQLTTPSIIAKYIEGKPRELRPCPVKTAKRMINGILYGQSLDAALTHNGVIIKEGTEHHPIITKLKAAVRELPDLIPSIDPTLERIFGVSWAACELASKDNKNNHGPGQLALLCQTIESAITENSLDLATKLGMTPALYAYDGFYTVAPGGLTLVAATTIAMMDETRDKFTLDMAFDTKRSDPLVVGFGELVRPEKMRLEREIHEICLLRMEADADFDPFFIKGAYDILALAGHGSFDLPENSQAIDSLAVYVSKFFVHNTGPAGMYTRIKWDPVIPSHIINTYAIGKNSLGEIAHLKFLDHLKVERMWLEVLDSRLPYQCGVATMATSLGYNLTPLKRVFGEPSRATTDFTFSNCRECKVVRDFHGHDTTYPLPKDSLYDLMVLLHLEYTLCGYDVEAFVFLHRLIATRLKRLHEKIPIIVQCSSATQGIGKNTFFEKLLGRLLLGDIRNKFEISGGVGDFEPVLSYLVSQSSMVGGRFNGYEAGLNLIVYDECARISDKVTQSQFKAKTTCDVISIEEKYKEVTQSVNMALSVFLSNYPVSLSVEPGCRRNFLIRVSDFAPRQTPDQTKKLHDIIDKPSTRWMYYRHLMTCNDIPTDLNTLQREIPLTDHKIAMMAVSDDLVNGIISALAGHPISHDRRQLVFSKRVILEALKASNPSNHIAWDTLSTRLVGSMVGPMQRHDVVWDIRPEGLRPEFNDSDLHVPPARLFGMDFSSVIQAHKAAQSTAATAMSKSPGDVKGAFDRFVREAIPAIGKAFTLDVSEMQRLAAQSSWLFGI
jgi:hypothetical protein